MPVARHQLDAVAAARRFIAAVLMRVARIFIARTAPVAPACRVTPSASAKTLQNWQGRAAAGLEGSIPSPRRGHSDGAVRRVSSLEAIVHDRRAVRAHRVERSPK